VFASVGDVAWSFFTFFKKKPCDAAGDSPSIGFCNESLIGAKYEGFGAGVISGFLALIFKG